MGISEGKITLYTAAAGEQGNMKPEGVVAYGAMIYINWFCTR
jgi:hypothetical protein